MDLSTMDPATVAALIEAQLAKMPKDVAGRFLEQLTTEAAAQEAKAITTEIVLKVTKLLKDCGEGLLDAIPAGRTLTIFHRAGLPAKDGQPATDPELVFNIETSAGATSNGATSPRNGSKVIRATLDGKTFEGNTWRALLDQVNETVKPDERHKIPTSPFSAHRAMDDMAKRLNKVKEGRLVVVGEVAPAVEPAKVDATEPAKVDATEPAKVEPTKVDPAPAS